MRLLYYVIRESCHLKVHSTDISPDLEQLERHASTISLQCLEIADSE